MNKEQAEKELNTKIGLSTGWSFSPVIFDGKKPIGWIGSHPEFNDRMGDTVHFTECPACYGTGKGYEGEECYLCKEE